MTPRPLSDLRRAAAMLAACAAVAAAAATSAPATPSDDRAVPLAITSDGATDAAPLSGSVTLQGRTAPLASLHAQVLAIGSAVGVSGGVQTIYDDTMTAAPDGSFAVTFPATGAARYEVQVEANAGNATQTATLTLFAQR
jgi:hypothetical protein